MRAHQRVASRNARFQQWQTLLTNRQKRTRAGRFFVQGVRPLTLAAEQGWDIEELLVDADRRLSRWAEEFISAVAAADAEIVALPSDLLAELGEKDQETAPELLAVVAMPPDDLSRIPLTGDFLGVAFDRPAQPGNLGTLIRSADAFGADGVVVTGHAADVYDPRTVRASTGSLFALPVVRSTSHRELAAWVAAQRARGCPIMIAGTDEHGDRDVFDVDFTQPTLLLVGNEAAGLSGGWHELCDLTVSIPMTGAASSLNAATAATAILYEIARQRILASRSVSQRP
jgi:TrmH family RNA methyltransferase